MDVTVNSQSRVFARDVELIFLDFAKNSKSTTLNKLFVDLVSAVCNCVHYNGLKLNISYLILLLTNSLGLNYTGLQIVRCRRHFTFAQNATTCYTPKPTNNAA